MSREIYPVVTLTTPPPLIQALGMGPAMASKNKKNKNKNKVLNIILFHQWP